MQSVWPAGGVIAVAGNIFIKPLGIGGGIQGSINEGIETMMSLNTLGFIDIAGNAEITATMYSNTYVRFRGVPYMIGGIVAKDTYFDGAGNPTIIYAGPGEGNGIPGFEFKVPIGPILIAYSEGWFN